MYEEKPAIILEDVLEAMFSDFDRKHPEQLKLSKWKEVLKEVAWNLKKVHRVLVLAVSLLSRVVLWQSSSNSHAMMHVSLGLSGISGNMSRPS